MAKTVKAKQRKRGKRTEKKISKLDLVKYFSV